MINLKHEHSSCTASVNEIHKKINKVEPEMVKNVFLNTVKNIKELPLSNDDDFITSE